MDQAGLHRMAQAHAGAQAADVLQAETDWAGPAPASVIASNIVTHRTLWRPALAQAAQRAAGAPGPVWMYRMDYASPLANGLLGAPHCGECAFAFNDVARQGRMYGYTQRDDYRPLQKAISDTWVQFAKTGDPNTPALPHWPRYTTGEQATMTLNAACKVETNPDAGLQRAWAPVPMIGGPQEIREAIVRLDSGASVVGPDPYRVRT